LDTTNYIKNWRTDLLTREEQDFLTSIEEEKKQKAIVSEQYSFLEKSNKHLQDSNMSFWYHFKHSISNGNRLLKYVITSYIHAVFPWLFKQHAARGLINMYEDMRKWPHLRKAMREEFLKRKND
jgi:hypothetical protein